MRIGIVGANGQVGAELCLLLARCPGVELVPICRTRSGSSFLRWQGLACRHGRVADALDAPHLLGDCDVVVNSSLATGTPAQIRRTEDRIVDHLFAYSRPTVTVVHLSTQSVYGAARPELRFRWRNPYGRAKLATERRVRRAQRITGKSAYILRLGHVCGELQEISRSIREAIRGDAVILPAQDHASNTTYTAAIVGAVLEVASGATPPGTYDLMNTPSWSWREVYEYETHACGRRSFRPRIAPSARDAGLIGAMTRAGRGAAGAILSAPWIAALGTKAFAYVPMRLNARAMAWWRTRRARLEIAALEEGRTPPEHLSWRANGVKFFPAARTTRELLEHHRLAPAEEGRRWPADLPDAGVGSPP